MADADLTLGDIAILEKCIATEAANMQFSATPKPKLDALREKLKAQRERLSKQATGE